MSLERIYLDNAATTPIHPEVVESMVHVMKEVYGNPSSTHAHGRKAKALVEESRSKIAALLHCLPSEICFTAGGTEADNMAIRCSVKDLGIKHIVSSKIEHHAVLHTVEELANKNQAQLHFVNLLADGHIDLTHLEHLLENNEHVLVSLMHGNNEIGNVLDIQKVSELTRKYHALFHCDTVQTMGHFAYNLSETPLEFLVGAAHKFNGPKGVGFLYVNKKNRLKPMVTGGSQERDMRGGTENVYGIVGMAKALEICYRDLEDKKQQLSKLKAYMKQKLIQNIPQVMFNGDSSENSLYTVLSASFPENEYGEVLLFNLDLAGISASGGSACSSGALGGSHVMNALYPNSNRTTVRFSFGIFNTEDEIDRTVEALKQWFPVPAAV